MKQLGTLTVGSPLVFINGIEYKYEPLMFDAKQLDISIKGFAGPVKLKWTKVLKQLPSSRATVQSWQRYPTSGIFKHHARNTHQVKTSTIIRCHRCYQATYLGTIPIMQKDGIHYIFMIMRRTAGLFILL